MSLEKKSITNTNLYLPIIFAVIATLCWAGNITLGKYVSEEVPPLGLSFWRWALATCIILPFVIKAMRDTWYEFLKAYKTIFLLALLGVTAYNSLIYLSLEKTMAVNVAILQSTSPIMILLLQFLLIRQRESIKQYLAIGISMLGVFVIIGTNSDITSLSFNHGDLFALIAIFVWAAYSVIIQNLPEKLKGTPVLGYTLILGTIMLFPFYLAESSSGRIMPLNLMSISSVVYTGAFASALAFACWNRAIELIGAAKTGQFMHCIPIFTLFMSIYILDEKLTKLHLVGIALIIISLVLSNFSIRKSYEIND